MWCWGKAHSAHLHNHKLKDFPKWLVSLYDRKERECHPSLSKSTGHGWLWQDSVSHTLDDRVNTFLMCHTGACFNVLFDNLPALLIMVNL